MSGERRGGGGRVQSERENVDLRGAGVVEAVAATLLLSVVVHGAWTVLERQRLAVNALVAWEEGLETARITRWVLADELRAGVGGRDWSVPAGDSVALRAFRGTGLVCPAPAEEGEGDPVLVHYRGVRRPNPAKDSVLLLDDRGRWHAVDLERREASSETCPAAPGLATERWWLAGVSDPADAGPVARLFERGSYHLADGALRYRRGAAGRQPLTPSRLASGSTLGPGEAWSVTVELAVDGGAGPGDGWTEGWTLWPRESSPESDP